MSRVKGWLGGSRPGVGRAALILTAGFIVSRLLGLVRNMAIGQVFGTSPELDAYFAAFRLPDLVFQLLAGAALGSAFIPTFSRYWRLDPEAGWRLAGGLLNIIFLAAAVASVVAAAAAPWLVPLTVPGFAPHLQNLTVRLTQIMLLSPVLFCLSGLATAILNARFRFLLPAVAPSLYNLFIIGGTLFLAPRWGVDGVVMGVVAGSAMHLLVQLPGLRAIGMTYRPRLELSHPGVAQVGRLAGPRVAALAATQANFFITTILASLLAPGSLSALSYAWALVMVPIGVFGMALSSAAFPTLADQAAQEDWGALAQTTCRFLALILFFTLPAAVGLVLLSQPVVAVLFERGEFGAESTQATAWALQLYALGLPAFAATEILSRGLYALSDTVTPLLWAGVALVLHLTLGLALLPLLGHGGLALSLSIAGGVEALGLVVFLLRRLRPFPISSLAVSLAKTGGATLAMASAVAILLALAPGIWIQAVGGVGVGALTFGLVARLLGSPELSQRVWIGVGRVGGPSDA